MVYVNRVFIVDVVAASKSKIRSVHTELLNVYMYFLVNKTWYIRAHLFSTIYSCDLISNVHSIHRAPWKMCNFMYIDVFLWTHNLYIYCGALLKQKHIIPFSCLHSIWLQNAYGILFLIHVQDLKRENEKERSKLDSKLLYGNFGMRA